MTLESQYEIKNGARTLKFSGRELAKSSSARPGSPRWVEFTLYKTNSGTYVLSRVGVSNVYHASVCPLVLRYGLHEAHSTDLTPSAVPCQECNPELSDPFVFPETHRYWTLTSEEPNAVLEALYKEDQNGARYLTKVAERLLQIASAQDADIDMVYRFEYID